MVSDTLVFIAPVDAPLSSDQSLGKIRGFLTVDEVPEVSQHNTGKDRFGIAFIHGLFHGLFNILNVIIDNNIIIIITLHKYYNKRDLYIVDKSILASPSYHGDSLAVRWAYDCSWFNNQYELNQ